MYWGKKWDTKKLIPCSFLHKKFNNRWKESLVIEIRILVVSRERKFNWKEFWRVMEKFYILIDYLGKYIQQNICLYVPYTFIFKNVFKIMKEKRIIRNWSQWVAMTVEVLLKWRIRKVESCWSMTWSLVRNFLNFYKQSSIFVCWLQCSNRGGKSIMQERKGDHLEWCHWVHEREKDLMPKGKFGFRQKHNSS